LRVGASGDAKMIAKSSVQHYQTWYTEMNTT